MLESLSPHLEEDDHLIVIEHEDHAGLPWHVAASSMWTCSYASGWTALLHLQGTPIPRTGPVSVAVVPAALESTEVLGAFASCIARTHVFAQSQAVSVDIAEGTACDRTRFLELLSAGGLMKVLCHGYQSARTYEVAWAVADNGALPSVLAVATDLAVGQRHRFGWREAKGIKNAPAVVFSAACSSGVAHVAGLGERLGLMAGLGAAGARAVVAPRWDAFAAEVLPVLDDAFERFWSGRGLARSVREACAGAESTAKWLRWAIAVEGDWR